LDHGKSFPEDFGGESIQMKELKDLVFNKIAPLIGKEEFYGKGTEEVDSKGD
jgi:hypothetical protein